MCLSLRASFGLRGYYPQPLSVAPLLTRSQSTNPGLKLLLKILFLWEARYPSCSPGSKPPFSSGYKTIDRRVIDISGLLFTKILPGARQMAHQLRTLATWVEDLVWFPALKSGSWGKECNFSSGDLVPYSGLFQHLHSYAYTHFYTYIHITKNKF